MVELKLLFFQPTSYKDVLGKCLYVFMTFLNTNGSILSFGKKKIVPNANTRWIPYITRENVNLGNKKE